MLGKIRKFSSTILAKVFLFIVAIPFVFWGMGDLFSGGDKNTIAKIGSDKISVKEFINFIDIYNPSTNTLNSSLIENMLPNFIGKKVIEKEIENLNITLSDKSLSKLIKNQKIFKKNNNFSRTEYEKFLISKNLNAVTFEKNMSNQVKKELLLDFVSGGIIPSNFLVNIEFDKINQERKIEVIKLNEAIKREQNFSDKEIQKYFNNNKNNYKITYRTIDLLEIVPKDLVGQTEFNDTFFEKLDEIDDLIVGGEKLNFITNKFNLNSANNLTFDKFGKDKNDNLVKNLSTEIIDNIFSSKEINETILITHENKYYIVELKKIEDIQKNASDLLVKKNIIKNLKTKNTRKFVSELADEINKNKFSKTDFDKFSIDKNIKIQNINIKNINDDKNLKKELVNEIYKFPKNRVMIVADIGLKESYLIYINEILQKIITKDSDEYVKYYNLAEGKMTSLVFNTYDSYLKKKYNIDINYKALENVKNYIK
jgi:peptidyl-prolyl cis-trans isomerase D